MMKTTINQELEQARKYMDEWNKRREAAEKKGLEKFYKLKELFKNSKNTTMKTLLSILTIVLVTANANGQTECKPDNYFYLGGGIGFSQKNALVNLQIGYNTSILGIEGSIIAHTDNRNPALLNGQVLKSFYSGNTRFTLLAGASYQITTFDKVGGTKTLPIVGMEWARIMNYHDAVIYVRGQVTGDNFCLMAGLTGIFKKQN